MPSLFILEYYAHLKVKKLQKIVEASSRTTDKTAEQHNITAAVQ